MEKKTNNTTTIMKIKKTFDLPIRMLFVSTTKDIHVA